MCAIFAGPLQTLEVFTCEALSLFMEHRVWQRGEEVTLAGTELRVECKSIF